MLAVVRKPHIELSIHGEGTEELLAWIRKKYKVDILSERSEEGTGKVGGSNNGKDDDESLIPIESTEFWQEMNRNYDILTPTMEDTLHHGKVVYEARRQSSAVDQGHTRCGTLGDLGAAERRGADQAQRTAGEGQSQQGTVGATLGCHGSGQVGNQNRIRRNLTKEEDLRTHYRIRCPQGRRLRGDLITAIRSRGPACPAWPREYPPR